MTFWRAYGLEWQTALPKNFTVVPVVTRGAYDDASLELLVKGDAAV
jgi:hypothetical protein